MDWIKHLFRQVSGGDYFLIAIIGVGVYYLAAKMENRQRFQITAFIIFLTLCIRLIVGISFIGLIVKMIDKIHFIYIWGPISLSIFITSMLYEKGNLGNIIVRSLIISVCICASLYFVFR